MATDSSEKSKRAKSKTVRALIILSLSCIAVWSIGVVVVRSGSSSSYSRESTVTVDVLDKSTAYGYSVGDSIDPTAHAPVYLLDSSHIPDGKDFFSATWLQPVEKFLMLETDRIKTVEAGCFAVIRSNRESLRMTLDWLDFSVEHMSQWWKVLGVFGDDEIPFEDAVSKFYHVVAGVRVNQHSTMLNTIAVIAFQQCTSIDKPERGKQLTSIALAATLGSLLQAGFGRVVVVGYREDDSEAVREAFRLLADEVSRIDEDKVITKIANMEVADVRATDEEVVSHHVKVNMVRAALVGMQGALQGNFDRERTKEWLGDTHDPSYWRYVYLTEPDSVLQTKPWVLPQLRDALDKGLILIPHRLQPLPHETDVIGMKDDTKFVRWDKNLSSVVNLDSFEGSVCCDELAGSYKPGNEEPHSCAFWWQCGFKTGNHSRLEPYQLMRLKSGTDIVLLAGNEQGRRCFPRTNSVCDLPSNKAISD